MWYKEVIVSESPEPLPWLSPDFPQTFFITVNLFGSHWAFGWPLVSQTYFTWLSRDWIIVSEDNALPCLAATLHFQLPYHCGAALVASWQCPPWLVSDLLYASSSGCSRVALLERRVSNNSS